MLIFEAAKELKNVIISYRLWNLKDIQDQNFQEINMEKLEVGQKQLYPQEVILFLKDLEIHTLILKNETLILKNETVWKFCVRIKNQL